jgi:hypothetical protein
MKKKVGNPDSLNTIETRALATSHKENVVVP